MALNTGLTRICPICRGVKRTTPQVVYGSHWIAYRSTPDRCFRCRGTSRVPISLPSARKNRERWLRVIQILTLYGPCSVGEIYQLLEKEFSTFSLSHALNSMNGGSYNLVHCRDGRAVVVWSLTRAGSQVQKAFCQECLKRRPIHSQNCSQPKPLKRIAKPAPNALASLLTAIKSPTI